MERDDQNTSSEEPEAAFQWVEDQLYVIARNIAKN